MDENEIKQKIEALEKEKSIAINNQQYDKASLIRDQILELTIKLEELSRKTNH